MDSKGAFLLSVFFVFTLVANFFFKQGASSLAPFTFSMDTLRVALASPQIWIGSAFYLAAAVAWLAALSMVPLNIAVSVSALLYIGIVLLAALVFHESIPLLRWGGIALIALGMLVIGRTA